jgi:putative drug exporter of the RND superfamily
MASILRRLGAFSVRHRWRVIAAWVILLVAVLSLALVVQRPASSNLTIPGTQAQQALDLLNSRFPGAGGAQAQVVFSTTGSAPISASASKAAIEASLAELRKAPQVVSVSDPFRTGTVSPSGKIAFATVAYPVAVGNVTTAAKNALLHSGGAAKAAGLHVNIGGEIAAPSNTSNGDVVGIVIAFIVLSITFASVLAAGVPLLSALVGLGTGLAAILAIGSVVTLSTTAPILATMLALAVGIDYGLFITTRHRQQLVAGMEYEKSIATAVATAGSSVCFAGATVVVALVALAIVKIPFLTVMGVAAAGAVVVAVAAALTFVPALLAAAGPRIIKGKAAQRQIARTNAAGYRSWGQHWVQGVTRRAFPVLVVGVAALVVMAIPAGHMRLGLPDAGTYPASSTDRQAYDLLAKGFGPGFNAPLLVVVDTPKAASAQKVSQALAQGAKGIADIALVTPPVQNPTHTLTLVTAIPKTGPNDPATKTLVSAIRARAAAATRSTGVEVLVTGSTALDLDVSSKLSGAIAPYLITVAILCILLLMLVFRSILVPIKAVIGYLFSVIASLGVTTWVFQEGHVTGALKVASTGPLVSFVPVILAGVLFGLAMDYEVFLVSRIREDYTHGTDPVAATISGYGKSARVVAAAAIIMTFVFASFITSQDLITKTIAFALAIGVIIDAFLVRMTLVPAVLTLLGRSAWWLPRWLGRALPKIDIEGENLAS